VCLLPGVFSISWMASVNSSHSSLKLGSSQILFLILMILLFVVCSRDDMTRAKHRICMVYRSDAAKHIHWIQKQVLFLVPLQRVPRHEVLGATRELASVKLFSSSTWAFSECRRHCRYQWRHRRSHRRRSHHQSALFTNPAQCLRRIT